MYLLKAHTGEYKYDEGNGLWYEMKGDYYFSCIALLESENKHIGISGKRHKCYLREQRKIIYTQLLISGRLNSYFVEIDRQAQERMEVMMNQMEQVDNVNHLIYNINYNE